VHRASHRRLEAWCLRRAAAVTAVNRPIADDLLARHTFLRGRTHVLANGFDPAEPADDVEIGPGFWFVHTGRLYGREEQTAAFLGALATLPEDVRALFVGVDESRVRPEADRLGLGARVVVEPLVPHARSLGLQRGAGALLLVNGRRPEAMSSKVFEYLQAGRPIFAISPEGSAARALFADTGGAVCVAPDEPMAGPLAAFVDDVRAGAGPKADAGALKPYELGSLTDELVGILGSMEAPHHSRD
jgi:glycosyltransferase involved in cell wall biosynthesis